MTRPALACDAPTDCLQLRCGVRENLIPHPASVDHRCYSVVAVGGTVSEPGNSSPAAPTFGSIIQGTDRVLGSGHGSCVKMQITNPFLFLVQESLGLLLAMTRPALACDAPTDGLQLRCGVRENLIPHPASVDHRCYSVVAVGGTVSEPGNSSPAAPTFGSIIQGTDRVLGSGHGSCVKMQITNPFLFLVQESLGLLLAMTRPALACDAPTDCLQLRCGVRENLIPHPASVDHRCYSVVAVGGTVSEPGNSSPAAPTFGSIIQGTDRVLGSGHGSCVKMQITNPFLFLVQESLGLLLAMTRPALACDAPTDGLQLRCGVRENLIPHPASVDHRCYSVVAVGGTVSEPGNSSPAAPTFGSIIQGTDRVLGSGHGSCVKMQITNPFLFLVQESLGLLLAMTRPALACDAPTDCLQLRCGVRENLIPHPASVDRRCYSVVAVGGTVSEPGNSSPAAPTFGSIIQGTDRVLGSGHGSCVKMQITNPFLFLVQESLGLLLAMTRPALACDAPTDGLQLRCGVRENLIPHPASVDHRCYSVVAVGGTVSEPGNSSPAAPPFGSIIQGTDRVLGSGHGSCVKMQITNPFLFLV
ncbi:hypothetical protein V5799_019237 [Amblyomma americanum]|uniref:Uncharacterized protein n=1 Tax=Amblyomma americanum TaxID=6943 RepID=A0AAQ4EXV7_AMBAM